MLVGRAGFVRERTQRADDRHPCLTKPKATSDGCVRQNRVVLAPVAGVKLAEERLTRPGSANPQSVSDGGKKEILLRGEHGISRKATAQGMSDALRCPVCSCAHFLLQMHTRPRVQRAPGIPCAL